MLEILEAREERVRQQDILLEKHGVPVVSFTLNIAGPVKDSPLICRAFRAGQEQLEAGLTAAKLPVLDRAERLTPPAARGCTPWMGRRRR